MTIKSSKMDKYFGCELTENVSRSIDKHLKEYDFDVDTFLKIESFDNYFINFQIYIEGPCLDFIWRFNDN